MLTPLPSINTPVYIIHKDTRGVLTGTSGQSVVVRLPSGEYLVTSVKQVAALH